MTNNIEVHRADGAPPVTTIIIADSMRLAIEMSGQSDPAVAIMVLAERDAKLITNALIESLPMQTLALVRDRLTRFGKDES